MGEELGEIRQRLANSEWIAGCACEDEGEFENARMHYEIAAILNHSASQSNLGNILDDKITPNDPRAAVYWYKRSVKNGNDVGAWNLHRHYLNCGNTRWSNYWLKIAFKMGNENARSHLKHNE